jgi:ATP-dependent RNA helicase DDX35
METLMVQETSQASAQQRAGRAGRVMPGKCYRLYTHAAFGQLARRPIPEMQRSNLVWIVLQVGAVAGAGACL